MGPFRKQLQFVLWPAALTLGVVSLAIARDHPGSSFAGTSLEGGVALLGTGWVLLACALGFWVRRPGNAIGPLLAVVSCAWFFGEWDNPGAPSIIFTIGLVLYAASPPFVAWTMLAYPTGRLSVAIDRVTVAIGSLCCLLLLGLLPALVLDPESISCAHCPTNLLQVSDRADVFHNLNRIGVQVGFGWSVFVIALTIWGVLRSSSARRRAVALVVTAGCVYLGLVAGSFGLALDRGYLGTTASQRELWLAQAVTLSLLSGAVGWGLWQARRTRSMLTKLVVELGEATQAGDLRDVLGGPLADPDLEIAYPLGDGRYVDASGKTVDLTPVPGRATTPLVRGGRSVAVLVHREGLLDNPDLVEEVMTSARLALENERLQAEVRAHLEDLRSSRARIIETGDAERRRLERDLHDGAQQRFVGVLLALRLLRRQLEDDGDARLRTELGNAEAQLNEAITELRELARGIHPAVLSDEGLAAAVDALAEGGTTSAHIGSLPEGRFPRLVETAAYLVIAEATKNGPCNVSAARQGRTLLVDIETASPPERLIELKDRVGALGGELHSDRVGDGIKIRAEIPCV